MLVSRDVRGATSLFGKSLFQSIDFLMASLGLVADVSLSIYILVEFSPRLGLHPRFMIIVTIVGLIGFWVRAIIQHGNMREVYDESAGTQLSRNDRLDEAMRVAETMFTTNLLFPIVLVLILLSQTLLILP